MVVDNSRFRAHYAYLYDATTINNEGTEHG